MSDALTDFIIKPAAPFAAGAILFGSVWGFFKGVESVLTDDSKLEVAVWLVDVRVAKRMEPWPDTFGVMFDRVFGKTQLSFNTFARSAIASVCVIAMVLTVLFVLDPTETVEEAKWATRHIQSSSDLIAFWGRLCLYFTIYPAYLALLKTNFILDLCKARCACPLG